MFLECRGSGAPTVVLIAGGFEAGWIWTYALTPDDPVHDAPGDAFSAGGGQPAEARDARCSRRSPSSPASASTTARTPRLGDDVAGERGGLVSTPVAQPHRLEDDVADLHALLEAAGEPGPYRARRPFLWRHDRRAVRAPLSARAWPARCSSTSLRSISGRPSRPRSMPSWSLRCGRRRPAARRSTSADAVETILAAPARAAASPPSSSRRTRLDAAAATVAPGGTAEAAQTGWRRSWGRGT